MVDGVGLGKNELADGDHGVAIVDKAGKDGGQRLRRVQGGVVEQHNAALLHPAGHPLADGVGIILLILHFATIVCLGLNLMEQ